jgi:hypothetical protein
MGGQYYQKWGSSKSSYVLLRRSQIAYMHVCHVRAIKFPMLLAYHKVQGNDLVYKLPKHAKDGIKRAIAAIDL